MLVLSDRQDRLGDGTHIHHVIRRFAERACGKASLGNISELPANAAPLLLRIMEEINHFLPRDWRMTRSRNNFRIFCSVRTTALESDFVLTGQTVRDQDGHICHIVHSVYRPEWLDGFDRDSRLEALSLTLPQWQKLTDEKREQVSKKLGELFPDLLRPNLYFISPAPDDSHSPLFARQYEKRTDRDAGWKYEFHRIHPLSRGGVDPLHYRWIRWNRNGTMEFKAGPGPGYRGASLWLLPLGKHKEIEAREKAYTDLLKEYGVTRDAKDWKPMAYETEYKFLIGDESADARQLFRQVGAIVKSAGVTVDSDRTFTQTDTYVDDSKFTLYVTGASLRIRGAPGVSRLTFKSKRAEEPAGSAGGPYLRQEEEITITETDAAAIREGREPNLAPLTLMRRVVPGCGVLKPVLQVRTERRLIVLRNSAGQNAELCLDRVAFLDRHNETLGHDAEIELESKGLPPEELAALAEALKEKLSLKPSGASKYERAIALLVPAD